MKKFILLVFYFFFVISTFSQKQPGTIGKWKVISVDDDEIFMDFKKDSFSINEDFKSNYSDDASLKRKKLLIKSEYSETHFVFGADKTFKKLLNNKIKISGSYQIDFPKERTIRISYKDALGKEVIDDCVYFDISPFMLFSMNNNTIRFMLEKAK